MNEEHTSKTIPKIMELATLLFILLMLVVAIIMTWPGRNVNATTVCEQQRLQEAWEIFLEIFEEYVPPAELPTRTYPYISVEVETTNEVVFYETYSDEKPIHTTISIPVLHEPISAARCYFKSWMDWRSITYRNSRQWRMQQIAYTCTAGFRRVDGLYMIALGTYFLDSGVGDVFDVTLSSGLTFRAVVGDVKSDSHTDPTNRFHLYDGSVIEFIVDREVMCRDVLRSGNIATAGFYGDVVSVERIPELFVEV